MRDTEIISLYFSAADLFQEANLFFRFHAFCQGLHAQFVRQFDQLFQDDGILPAAAEVSHQVRIQFDQVKIKILQQV